MSDIRVNKLGFEVKTCGRCGGSGHYSYCQRFGTTCFGCQGSGAVFTQKGFAANAFYQESLMVPLGSLAIGESMRHEIMSISGDMTARVWVVVDRIEPSGCMHILPDGTKQSIGIHVSGTHPKYGPCGVHGSADLLVRKAWSAEAKAPKIKAALAYQASLTKAGKPSKRNAEAYSYV